MLLDLAMLSFSFLLAYRIRYDDWTLFQAEFYAYAALLLLFIHFIVSLFTDNYKNVLKRDWSKELVSVLQMTVIDIGSLVFCLFLLFPDSPSSRVVVGWFCILAPLLLYLARLAWKRLVLSRGWRNDYQKSHLLVVSCGEMAESALRRILENRFGEFEVVGLVLTDDSEKPGEMAYGVPVVCSFAQANDYILNH